MVLFLRSQARQRFSAAFVLLGTRYVAAPARGHQHVDLEMPGVPLKLAAPMQPTLRRLSAFDNS